MRKILNAASILAMLLLLGVPIGAQSPRDFDARVRLRMEQAQREKAYEELKEKTTELAEATRKLVEEVESTNSYTTSAEIIEGSNRIEDLAKEIEDLAKTIKNRTQGR